MCMEGCQYTRLETYEILFKNTPCQKHQKAIEQCCSDFKPSETPEASKIILNSNTTYMFNDVNNDCILIKIE